MNKITRTLIFAVTALIILTSFSQRTYARNVFRNIFRGIKNVSRFIVTLPDKSTRWMGPVLGPIAAEVISQNLLVNKHVGDIFRHANRINQNVSNIEEQKKYLNQVQTNLRNQSNELKEQAQQIRDMKNNLERDLLSRNISYNEYKNKTLSLENLADAYDRTAERFSRAAENIKPNDLIRMIARNTWNQTIRKIRNEVKFTVKNELDRFANPVLIQTLLGEDNKSMDQVLDILLSGNISSILAQGNYKIDGDELRNRVRDRVKNILDTNKDNLKNNWRSEIDKVIKEEIKALEEERKNLPQVEKESPESEGVTETSEATPTGEGGCAPGYTFCPRCGITCIQKNCGEIENTHYSYESYCVCGSSGSIAENPKDPNKECNYTNAHKACPGCVYACVHFDEECPLEGIGEQ